MEPGLGGGVVDLPTVSDNPADGGDGEMRPQRVRIMGSSSGCVMLKNPFSDTSITLRHCSRLMPAMGASS